MTWDEAKASIDLQLQQQGADGSFQIEVLAISERLGGNTVEVMVDYNSKQFTATN